MAQDSLTGCNGATAIAITLNSLRGFSYRFLLGTGRMPHPVGGAIGVALCTAVKIKGDKPASY